MAELSDGVQPAQAETYILEDDGTFPNNQDLPLLLYRQVLDTSTHDPAGFIEKLFQHNGWTGCWRNGIYSFHHYHSTAHEVLGLSQGEVTVQMGGKQGRRFTLRAGDVVVLPAGTAHKNEQSTGNFQVVGAYPRGQDWDMNYGKSGERPRADENISRVPLPDTDPIFGKNGPLMDAWS